MPVTIKRNKIKSVADFEKQFKKGSGNGGSSAGKGPLYPTRVGYKGRNVFSVRFLAGPEQWVNYFQYWDPSLNRPVIQTEENEAEYDERGLRPSIIHLAPALDIETGQVVVLELKWSLVKDVQALREKYSQKGLELTEFDVELEKRGSTKEDTEYRATYDGKVELDLSRYPIPGGSTDWQDYLWKFLDRLVGNDDDEDDDAVEDDDSTDEADVSEEEVETPVAVPAKKRVLRKVGASN